jgi:hypothetical protein
LLAAGSLCDCHGPAAVFETMETTIQTPVSDELETLRVAMMSMAMAQRELWEMIREVADKLSEPIDGLDAEKMRYAAPLALPPVAMLMHNSLALSIELERLEGLVWIHTEEGK